MVVSKKRWPCGKVPRQRVSRSSQRSMMTHVCLLTHDKDVQKVLPQYVISNQRSISAKMLQGMEVVPAEVIFLRRKSAWVTGKVLLQILARLVEALQKYRSKFQPILALDCCKVHLTSEFVKACADAKIWLLYIPTLCTHILQPADTHCFAVYKKFLKERFRASKDACGFVPAKQWMSVMVDVTTKFLQDRDWTRSFAKRDSWKPWQSLKGIEAVFFCLLKQGHWARQCLKASRGCYQRNRKWTIFIFWELMFLDARWHEVWWWMFENPLLARYCQGPNMSHKNTQVFQAQKQHRPCASNTALVSVLPCLQRPRRRCCMKSWQL